MTLFWTSGVGSLLPPSSTARTEKSCEPSETGGKVCGLVQGTHGPASTRHSNVAGVSLEKKYSVGLDWLWPGPVPPPQKVSGALESVTTSVVSATALNSRSLTRIAIGKRPAWSYLRL